MFACCPNEFGPCGHVARKAMQRYDGWAGTSDSNVKVYAVDKHVFKFTP